MSDDEGPAVDDGVDDADIIDLDSDSDLESDEGERSEGSGGEDSEEEDGEEDAGEAGPAASGARGAARAARRPVGGRPDPLSRESNTSVRVIVVPEWERITSGRLCLTEAAGLLAERAEQIARTGTHFVLDIRGRRLHDPVEIAVAELLERRCPLILRRTILLRDAHGNSVVEDWDPNQMSLPDLPRIGGSRRAAGH
jgi:DNA-directed RNA polymerase subunit K/omega